MVVLLLEGRNQARSDTADTLGLRVGRGKEEWTVCLEDFLMPTELRDQ